MHSHVCVLSAGKMCARTNHSQQIRDSVLLSANGILKTKAQSRTFIFFCSASCLCMAVLSTCRWSEQNECTEYKARTSVSRFETLCFNQNTVKYPKIKRRQCFDVQADVPPCHRKINSQLIQNRDVPASWICGSEKMDTYWKSHLLRRRPWSVAFQTSQCREPATYTVLPAVASYTRLFRNCWNVAPKSIPNAKLMSSGCRKMTNSCVESRCLLASCRRGAPCWPLAFWIWAYVLETGLPSPARTVQIGYTSHSQL